MVTMQLISINMPKETIEGLDELVRQGTYPNRSEAIRFAIRDLLKEEVWRKQHQSVNISRAAE